MKLSEYVEILKEILEEHGDLNLIYSKDDEGNGFNFVSDEPAIVYKDEDRYNFDIYLDEDFDDESEKENYEKVVCVN